MHKKSKDGMAISMDICTLCGNSSGDNFLTPLGKITELNTCIWAKKRT